MKKQATKKRGVNKQVTLEDMGALSFRDIMEMVCTEVTNDDEYCDSYLAFKECLKRAQLHHEECVKYNGLANIALKERGAYLRQKSEIHLKAA